MTIYTSNEKKAAVAKMLENEIQRKHPDVSLEIEDGEFGGNHSVMFYIHLDDSCIWMLCSDADDRWISLVQDSETCEEDYDQSFDKFDVVKMAANACMHIEEHE